MLPEPTSRPTGPTPSVTSQSRLMNAFTSNGLKTIEVYATDDAGSLGNKVMLSFTLQLAARAGSARDSYFVKSGPSTSRGSPGYRHRHARLHHRYNGPGAVPSRSPSSMDGK